MPPVAIAAGVGIAGGVAGGIIQGNAARDAANTQAAAANNANATQLQMFNDQRADIQPWKDAGVSALYGDGGLFKRSNPVSGITQDQYNANYQDFKQKRLSDILAARNDYINSTVLKPQSSPGDSNGHWTEDKDEKRVWTPNDLTDQQKTDLTNQYLSTQATGDKLNTLVDNEWNSSDAGKQAVDKAQYQVDPELTRAFTNDDFVKDPGYDFRMAEGQKAIERSAAAKGGLQSGGTLKALSQYGQNFASNEYQNAYNRFNTDRSNKFNRLSSIAGIGQNATSQLGQAGQNYANQYGQNTMGSANAQGAAGIAASNGWANTLSGIGNLGMQGAYINALGNQSGIGSAKIKAPT